MPNCKTHLVAGTIAGAGNALARSYDQGALPACAETLGGALGGYVAGALPDVFEPALTPRHRSTAHSWATVVTAVTWVNGRVSDGQRFCRQRAEHYEAQASTSTGFDAFMSVLAAAFWRLLSGFLAGLQGGYVSHLALDSLTPAGLPALG